jgi:glycosyltransferase involved in cell wall biosynthesis
MLLSVIIVFHNMKREAPRTLFSLSSAYQNKVDLVDYEVIAIDCGLQPSLTEEQVKSFGQKFRLIRTSQTPSPAAAINEAARKALGQYLTICIDGARIWSPGIIAETCAALAKSPDAVVATSSFHLGHEIQNISMSKGYNQPTEDSMLENLGWETDGYKLFQVACPAGSSRNGWFLPLNESNCITLSRTLFKEIKGYDERFSSPGGGLVNIDFFARVCLLKNEIHILIGEGTFHQIHGGVSTNVPMELHPWKTFHQEYIKLVGKEYVAPKYRAVFQGVPNIESGWMLQYSYDHITGILSTPTAESEKKHNEAYATISALTAESEKKQQTIDSLNRQSAEIRHQLYQMVNSKSWRLTHPLRVIFALIQKNSV